MIVRRRTRGHLIVDIDIADGLASTFRFIFGTIIGGFLSYQVFIYQYLTPPYLVKGNSYGLLSHFK